MTGQIDHEHADGDAPLWMEDAPSEEHATREDARPEEVTPAEDVPPEEATSPDDARAMSSRRAWTSPRSISNITAAVVLTISVISVFRVVHLDLVFKDNTPTGGDMGAHVFAPAFLRDVLLPNFQLSGWSNYWYAGFPLYRFYMVVPALMIVALNVVLPYGVAFKVVTILGLVTLPVCCWAFGRLAKLPYPIPELLPFAALWFLYEDTFYLLGGNVKSTMAGEFSFSIALSFAILGLGLFARALDSGRGRGWAAAAIALAMLSHGIVLLFVVGAALLMWLVWMDRTRLVIGLQVLGTAFLLSAFWVIPFVFNHKYMTDMKYGGRPEGNGDSFWAMFFPWSVVPDLIVLSLALFGFVVSVVRRNLIGAWLGIVCIGLMAMTYLARNSLPLVGLLWNPRLLPFLYLMRLMLAMVGVAELVRVAVSHLRWERQLSPTTSWVSGLSTAAGVGLVALVTLLISFRELPEFFGKNIDVRGKTHYGYGIGGWYPFHLSAPECGDQGKCSHDAAADGWTSYNFNGYEGLPAYAEYRDVVNTMASLGKNPAHGCGRATYENNEKIGGYGTSMALELLPHWTNGCITSMEGVFFEASGTTPYHFVSVDAVSEASSQPVRGLSYDRLDMAKGERYLRTLGVRYLMVFTQKAKDAAKLQPGWSKVGAVGPWHIYELDDTRLAVGLTTEPVVVNDRGGDQRERYLEVGMSWFQHQDAWAAIPATDGPADWQHIDVEVDPTAPPRTSKAQVDRVVPVQEIERRTLPEVTVSNFTLNDQDLSFDVDRVGVPVLVKVSYFPNWTATGAEGPYRAGANQMIVIPTSKHVTMSFDRSTVDIASLVLSGLGLIAVVLLWRFPIRWRSKPEPALAAASGDVPVTEWDPVIEPEPTADLDSPTDAEQPPAVASPSDSVDER